MKPLDYAEQMCQTLMRKFTVDTLPPAMGFHYHQGVFLNGMEQVYFKTGKREYADYIKNWVDQFISEDGEISGSDHTQFDDLQPATLIFRLIDEYGDEKYKKALDKILPLFKTWKCNEYGGFWHKEHYPNQMWLDGLYMAGPLAIRYANLTGDKSYAEIPMKQMRLMWDYIRDQKTGLLYHAWDPTKEAVWANPVTGCAPNFWGRAMGWYVVALMELADGFPENSPQRKELLEKERLLMESLFKYQDEKSGMWYQVLDKGELSENWLETSCSCLFVYAAARAQKAGALDKTYEEKIQKAYNGILKHAITTDENGLHVNGVCIGTGVSDLDFYLHRPTVTDDLHGAGAFILMCTALD